ncbi:MAG: gliding motility protein GldM [Bacteroidetes bacterium]|nr:gliding motility protein GldM [Bacteroidota bacterium]
MGHGKETPRQKMIGMMYLVLTAMLALNVAKEVLNAFILVDEGLVTTTENFAAKNTGLYNTFHTAYELNPAKVGDWKDKAEAVQTRSNELYSFMHECKTDILSIKEAEAIDPDHEVIHWDFVEAKDNMDWPGQIMIVEGKATELKGKIEEYKDFVLSLIEEKDKYAGTVEALEGILSTELPDVELEHGGKKVVPTWETTYFDMLPLASVITLLSNMQANVRNAEAEMLNFLLGQVEAGDIPINTLKAVVMPDHSLVFPGQEYRARVFLAAYDSTNTPDVVLDNGTVLEVESGMGVYTSSSNSLGIKSWGGTIKLDNDGQIIERDFTASYEVAEANATISATAMNVFYRGLSNPVAVSAGGVAESSVRVTINNPHNIKRNRPGVYQVKPGSQGKKATVSVYADIDGSSKLMTRMDFRVLDLPTPTAKITGSRGGKANLTVGQLSGLKIVEAEAEEFLFEVDFEVTSFTIGFNDDSGIWVERQANSNKITSEQKSIFRSMRAGQRMSIENIKAIGPDGKVRSLSPINITVR